MRVKFDGRAPPRRRPESSRGVARHGKRPAQRGGPGNFKPPQCAGRRQSSTESFGWPRRDRHVARLPTLSTIERRWQAAHPDARHWIDMKNKTRHEHETTDSVTLSPTRPSPPKSSPNWKPQPCGLSREELREIVAQIMG
jgi:hypothetical protein